MALSIVKEHLTHFKIQKIIEEKYQDALAWHGRKPMNNYFLCWIFLLRIVDSQILCFWTQRMTFLNNSGPLLEPRNCTQHWTISNEIGIVLWSPPLG
jgi:hypothetical protein